MDGACLKIKGYHRIEHSYGEFVRTVAVPSTVDMERVQADYKDGLLTITLPKREAAKPRQVKGAGENAYSTTKICVE